MSFNPSVQFAVHMRVDNWRKLSNLLLQTKMPWSEPRRHTLPIELPSLSSEAAGRGLLWVWIWGINNGIKAGAPGLRRTISWLSSAKTSQRSCSLAPRCMSACSRKTHEKIHMRR